ncbi:multiprotein-bridging factor 1 family protein [Kitasatospora sp. NPDC101183]|uniref:helix-turn-helix domain-containing protein n=1 Tax=Kitasatospora sp. NPDC101183 TaxID=3364100 RepID=UPI003807DCD9
MSGEFESLAKALVAYRESQGLSVQEVAHRAELSMATIRCFERETGRTPTPFVAERFEVILGLPPGTIPSEPNGGGPEPS